MEAMLFMVFFGAALLLAAFWLAIIKDPRRSILLYKVYGIKNMSLEETRRRTKQIAKIVAIIGILLIIVFGAVYVINVLLFR